MKEFFQIIVVLLLAIPFIYMMYDIGKEMIIKSYQMLSKKTKPILTGIVSFFVD